MCELEVKTVVKIQYVSKGLWVGVIRCGCGGREGKETLVWLVRHISPWETGVVGVSSRETLVVTIHHLARHLYLHHNYYYTCTSSKPHNSTMHAPRLPSPHHNTFVSHYICIHHITNTVHTHSITTTKTLYHTRPPSVILKYAMNISLTLKYC